MASRSSNSLVFCFLIKAAGWVDLGVRFTGSTVTSAFLALAPFLAAAFLLVAFLAAAFLAVLFFATAFFAATFFLAGAFFAAAFLAADFFFAVDFDLGILLFGFDLLPDRPFVFYRREPSYLPNLTGYCKGKCHKIWRKINSGCLDIFKTYEKISTVLRLSGTRWVRKSPFLLAFQAAGETTQ